MKRYELFGYETAEDGAISSILAMILDKYIGECNEETVDKYKDKYYIAKDILEKEVEQ